MKKKMPLPDALLDALSGGVLTLDGAVVDNIDLYLDGMEVTTSKGTEFIGWKGDDLAAVQKDPDGALDTMLGNLVALRDDSRTFEMTEIFDFKTV